MSSTRFPRRRRATVRYASSTVKCGVRTSVDSRSKSSRFGVRSSANARCPSRRSRVSSLPRRRLCGVGDPGHSTVTKGSRSRARLSGYATKMLRSTVRSALSRFLVLFVSHYVFRRCEDPTGRHDRADARDTEVVTLVDGTILPRGDLRAPRGAALRPSGLGIPPRSPCGSAISSSYSRRRRLVGPARGEARGVVWANHFAACPDPRFALRVHSVFAPFRMFPAHRGGIPSAAARGRGSMDSAREAPTDPPKPCGV